MSIIAGGRRLIPRGEAGRIECLAVGDKVARPFHLER
jgi:hypothetical protein